MVQQGDVQPVKVSLKVKALVFISLMILAVGASLSWYFLRQAQGILTDELQRRALSLTKNLAHASQYGVLTRDEGDFTAAHRGHSARGQCAPGAHYRCPGHCAGPGLQGACRRRFSATCHRLWLLQDIAVPASQVTVPVRALSRHRQAGRLPCGGAHRSDAGHAIGTYAASDCGAVADGHGQRRCAQLCPADGQTWAGADPAVPGEYASGHPQDLCHRYRA